MLEVTESVTYKVTAKTTLERNRLNEHGDLWKLHDGPHVDRGDYRLLESITTGYVRWWNLNQITRER